ncbi:MAG: phenolic acid decarboxylase [Campylobacteraceae bacterium]
MNLKKALLSFAIIGLFGINANANDLGQNSIVGKIVGYSYGDSAYEVDFKSEKVLHWKGTKGEEKGLENDENYEVQKIDKNTFFVSWIEEGGTIANIVLNLSNKQVYAFLQINKEIIPLKGTITSIKNSK